MASVRPSASVPKRADLRSARRHRAHHQAKIVVDAQTMIHCEVENISTGGAKIAVRANVRLPESFLLYIASHTLQVFRAILRWRDGDFAGVSFADGTSLRAAKPPRIPSKINGRHIGRN
jgi:hypothetical protein